MAPIRLALIGLSEAAKTSWASQGHLPYLLSARGKERYKIIALLNSSADAAKRAIEAYSLGSDVKAYGSPQDLAADEDVDLVACTTRVDVHYSTIKPSVEAGKNVFVEWPLAENGKRAGELAEAAKESGSKTIVGLQGRTAPPILKLKEVLRNGTIGKVVSSEFTAFTPGGGGNSMSEGLAYFLDKKVGGNPVTIAFAHTIDYVHHVLGEYASSNAHVQIQRPHQSIIDAKTGEKRPTVSDVPDLVSVHGTLKSSNHVTEGATLIANFRTGPAFPGSTPFVWTITGGKGRLRITCERGPFIQSLAAGSPIPIEVEDFGTGEVKSVDWEWQSWEDEIQARGRCLGRLYDLYYGGKAAENGVADFDAAVARHKQIDAMLY